MNITDIIKIQGKPALYEKGTAFMWTDKHISRQLLNIHLDPDIDLASRRGDTIKRTVVRILEEVNFKSKLNILDMGCGPGLYAEQFALKGHTVTGVDISQTSVEYAKRSAKEKALDIQYIHADYLDLNLESDQFDLVIMIYTDFGVLLPNEREHLMNTVFKVLKKGGLFIFDVLTDNELELKLTPKNWEVEENGFWKASPYLVLSESFLYEDQKVILYQHIIADSENMTDIYRFWTHFFSKESMGNILNGFNFGNIHFMDDIIPPVDQWSGKQVLFCFASKEC